MANVRFQGTYYETLNELLEEQPGLSVEIDKRNDTPRSKLRGISFVIPSVYPERSRRVVEGSSTYSGRLPRRFAPRNDRRSKLRGITALQYP